MKKDFLHRARNRRCPTHRRAYLAWLPVLLVFAWAPASAEDLLSIYKLALGNDPRFRAAEASYNATKERVPQARAALLPTFSVTAGINRNYEEVATDDAIFSRPAGEAEYRSDEYRLSLTQPIYNAAAWASLRQANAEVRRAEVEYLVARQDLILRVAEAYFDALLAQDTFILAQSEREALARNLESAESRKKAGMANIAEVNDAQARFHAALAQEIEASNRIDDSREALREISGRTPSTISELDESAVFVAPDPPDLSAWVDSALRQNLNIREAYEATEVAREGIEQNRAAHLPTLEAVGSRSRLDADRSIPGPGVRSTNTVIGLQLSVPLYQGGLVSARTREASHRYDAALQELEGQRRSVERAARTTFQGATSGAARIEALKQAVASAKSALAAKTEGAALGLYTTLDVLDSTRDLYRNKRDFAEARHTYLLNFLQLKAAAGTLSEDDVLTINRWLN